MCENIILQKKLGFVFHLANLAPDTLAKQVFSIEVANQLEGIVSQCMEHIVKLGVNEISELSSISKWKFKKRVRNYIHKKNAADLLESIKQYKKLDYNEMKQESYERKSYFFQYEYRRHQICLSNFQQNVGY